MGFLEGGPFFKPAQSLANLRPISSGVSVEKVLQFLEARSVVIVSPNKFSHAPSETQS